MDDYARKMRRASIFCFAVAAILMAWMLMGCGNKQTGGPVSGGDMLATADRIYTSIRIVVTDPDVMPLFSEKDLATMAELERTYLAATKTLRESPDDAESVQVIAGVATDILSVIGGVEFAEQYRPVVAGIRISVNLLRNRLGS